MRDQPRDPVEAEYLRRIGTPEQLVGPATKTYAFTLFIHGVDILGDASMDALYEAGCDDATFGARDGAQYGEFDREATSFSTALASAIHAMTNALAGLELVYVERDDLVSMAKIAERSGRSRELIRLLAAEERGPTLPVDSEQFEDFVLAHAPKFVDGMTAADAELAAGETTSLAEAVASSNTRAERRLRRATQALDPLP